ncbi:MAG: ABC transporter ATP-binding protein [Phycisphaeraceae bacterium]|nr:ABC transporter ATP-binding protein [Phycisphaeraceae bacterium]
MSDPVSETSPAETTADVDKDEPIIRVRDLVKIFGTQTVLDGINLDIDPGEIMVIMGGSGCGKSTFLRHMIGSLKPNEGTVEVLGTEITNIPERELNEVRKKIGILFQSGALFNSMTLRQNVALPMEEHTDLNRETIDIMVTIKLELMGLREHGEKYPSQISGGMKKRAGLARALALDPKILFYDEPSAGLDPVTSAEIDQLMIKLSRQLGVTSVVVTHEMDSAFTIADRMAMLDKGRMLMVDRREEFERLRDSDSDDLTRDQQLIRQFLRGAPDGPITERKKTSGYADELLGTDAGRLVARPSVQATR